MDGSTLGTTAIIATVLVPFVSLIKRPTYSAKVNYAISMAAALIAGVAGALIDGNVQTAGQAATLALTALGTSQTVYMLYFRDTDINNKLTGN